MADVLAELRDRYGIRLKSPRAGENYTTCPNCSDQRKPANRKKPCLSVKLDADGGAVFRCAHCDWHGNVPGRRYAPGTGTEAHTARFGSERPQPRPAAPMPTQPHRSAALRAFFERRAIPLEIVEELEIYQGRHFFPQVGQKSPCIVFPYRFRGQLVNNKYRHPQKHFMQDKDALRTLYNVDSLIDNDTAIWVEGEMDVLACRAAGLDGVVSLPDGAPSKHKDEIDRSEKRYEAIANCAELLGPIRRHILAVDSDEPGEALAYQLAHRLGPPRCFRPRWPSDCKDPNEVLIRHGPEQLRRLIENARGYPLKGVIEIQPGDLLNHRSSPKQAKYGLGLEAFDELLQFRPGQLVVVIGVPAHGKSEIIDFVMVQLTRQYGWRWAVCSPEHETLDHAARLAEKWAGQPFLDYGPEIRAMDDMSLESAELWVGRNFSFIVQNDEDQPLAVDFILDRTREIYIRDGIKGLVIDPYNELAHERGNMSETDYVGLLLRRLKAFARAQGIMVVLVVHPQKLQRDRDGKRPIPTLYDAAGSAHFFNKSDVGFAIHRPDNRLPDVDIHVQKMKRKDQGRPGQIKLTWDRYTGLYRERGD